MNEPNLFQETAPCPLGCASGDDVVLVGRDLLHGRPGEFPVVRCRRCQLMRTNPRPTRDSIGFYYPSDEYGPYVSTQVPAKPASLASRLRRVVRHQLRLNTNPLPHLPPGRVLEVGCASGLFLSQMKGQGWAVQGIEFSSGAANHAKAAGLDVFVGAIEQAPDPEEKFDLVVGWMVLEHLSDPVSALRRLACWTNDGGLLAISVPNAASYEFKLFRDKWYALQVPTHLFHFTPATVANVLRSSGWTVQKIFHQRVLTNLLISLGYCLQERRRTSVLGRMLETVPARTPALNALLYPLAFPLAVLGQTGRMSIWATKDTQRICG